MRMWLLFLCAVLSVTAIAKPPSQPSRRTLKKTAQFDLPGPASKRFDYLTIDTDDRYPLSTHLAAGQTYVIDLRSNKVVVTIADTPGAEGIEYVPNSRSFIRRTQATTPLASWTWDR
jgi:hypothetical protein